METLKNEFRWRMVKRKKQVVNLCAALGFILTFGMAESGLADSVNALPSGSTTSKW